MISLPDQAFLCSVCGATSHNPNDVASGYCGRCSRHTSGCVYFTGQAANAIPNGQRVRKANSRPGDGHPDGSLGTVLSSMSHPEIMGGVVFYFVEWDANPRFAVGTLATKVELAIALDIKTNPPPPPQPESKPEEPHAYWCVCDKCGTIGACDALGNHMQPDGITHCRYMARPNADKMKPAIQSESKPAQSEGEAAPMTYGEIYAAIRILEVFAPADPLVSRVQTKLGDVARHFHGTMNQIGEQMAMDVDRVEKMDPPQLNSRTESLRKRVEEQDARIYELEDHGRNSVARALKAESELATANARIAELEAAIFKAYKDGGAAVDKANSEFGYDSLRFADVRHGWLVTHQAFHEIAREIEKRDSKPGAKP